MLFLILCLCWMMGFASGCWSGKLEGKYIKEQHGATNECYDFEVAKRKCEEASDCHGIATQSNHCFGKYRVTHGSTATLLTYGNWKAYNLWAYTFDRTCISTGSSSWVYKGCYVNKSPNRVHGHINHRTWTECRNEAVQRGKSIFGMEYPQGSATAGDTQCLILDSQLQYTKMDKVSESECEAEGLHDGKRLGSADRLAVYELTPDVFTLSGSSESCMNGVFTRSGTRNGAPSFVNTHGGVVQYENTEQDWGYKYLCGRKGCWTTGCGGHHRHFSVSDVKKIVNGMKWSNRAGAASGTVETVLGVCPQGWIAIGSLCYSPATQGQTGCTSQDCDIVERKCTDEGARLPSKDELQAWLNNGGAIPSNSNYGVTAKGAGGCSAGHWLSRDKGEYGCYGWTCCDHPNRYHICVKGYTYVSITGVPGCAPYTKKMATGLANTHKEVSECDRDVKFVRDKFGDVHEVTSDINDITKNLAYVSKTVKQVYDRIVLLPPKGLGIADMLGKIPKIGIFIKSGMKFAQRVIDTVNRILQRVHKITKKVNWVVNKGKQTFTKIAQVTDPATKFLKHSSDVMNAAVGCMGGNCNSGTVGQKLETANREAWNNGGGTALSTTETMGKTCSDVLNPTKLVMATIADIGKQIKHVLAPLQKVVNLVGQFFRDMNAAMERFMRMLSENDHVQCALAIIGHVAEPFNLLMCGFAEVQNGLQFIMEGIIWNLEVVITDIMNDAIEAFVELIIPDNFAVTIPDFKKVLPVDAWFVGCTAASLAWPQYASDIQKWNQLPLPYTLTGKQMEQEILEDAKMSMPRPPTWKSACAEAWEELKTRTDFSRCDKAWGTTIFQDIDTAFDTFKNLNCWDLKKMNCKQGCPGGWEHFLTTNHGCCSSFVSCGGNMKNCRRYKCHGSPVCRVTLFQHDHFGGAMKTYYPGTYSSIWRNDDVTSIKVDGDGCHAIAYEHGNLNGWKVTIPKGHYTYSQLSRMGFRNDAMSSLRVGGSGTHTGYCKPNTAASRVGGYNRHSGYKDLVDCYLRRCVEDSSCVAATFGHGECIAYKQCEGLVRDGNYHTMYKQVGRRRFEDLEMLKPTTNAEAETLKIMKRRMEEHGLFVPSNTKEAELLGAFHRRLEEYEMMHSADATNDEMFPPTNTTKLEMLAPATDADVTAEA